MEWIAIVTILALVEFIWLGIRVGAARGKYEIKAPATTGHDIFERAKRSTGFMLTFVPTALLLLGGLGGALMAVF
ncbi:MAG: hypothetical protein E4H11_08370 [Myxococcales bacterium]|jgi:hypothetical protein|nr:MAG: hypothetical protein E4H11_08370 [Myxococcales bacterium]